VTVETVYAKQLTLTVKPGTKPGTKYKISGKGRIMDGRTGDMYVTMDARMVELTLEMRRLLESIRDQI
jgi:DnaJ-class molecular chaperone